MEHNAKLISLIHYKETKNITFPVFYTKISNINLKTSLKRYSAFFIDIYAIMFIKICLELSYIVFIDSFFFFLNPSMTNQLFEFPFWMQTTNLTAIFFSYFILSFYCFEGKTLGKALMKLKTISNRFFNDPTLLDPSLTFKESFFRTVGMFLCYISFGTLFAINYFSENKQGLADAFGQSHTVNDDWFKFFLDQKIHNQEVVTINLDHHQKMAA